MNGDFTPLRDPKVVFKKLYFPDGRVLRIETKPASMIGPCGAPGYMTRPEPKDTFTGKTVEFVRTGFLNAREEVVNTWKSDDKWDRLQQAGYSYLPYHPQYVPKLTQVAVELKKPLRLREGSDRFDQGRFCDAAAGGQHHQCPSGIDRHLCFAARNEGGGDRFRTPLRP